MSEMNPRFQYAEVRQKIINALKTDLMGPGSKNEILDENPMFAYLVGMLYPQSSTSAEGIDISEQEIEEDASYEEGDFTADAEDDNEPMAATRFKQQTSLGISFYIKNTTSTFDLDISWGDYSKSTEERANKDGKTINVATYSRHPMQETVTVSCKELDKTKEFGLSCDAGISVHISRIRLKEGYSLITTYITNKRPTSENSVESLMFQVQLKACSPDGEPIFIAEHLCRQVLQPDEFYFAQRPIFSRGRGCAATWGEPHDSRCSWVCSDFIPQYEFPGVSASLEGFDRFYFSMRFMSSKAKKVDIIFRLTLLADSYDHWIETTLVGDSKMTDPSFRKEVGNSIIEKCKLSAGRIREGIKLLTGNELAFDAFCFMNRAMILQRNIMNFSKQHGAGIECNFKDYLDPRKPENDFGWYPFQIAFILMNLCAMVDPDHKDRDVVDLLYFPTGGGKTEAYMGLMAFVIANRRLHATEDCEFNRDGGVTAILRYTLRLLTTQQRDRITKMVIAAEMIRRQESPKYGTSPISIGFWVGSGVTPNKFKDLVEDSGDEGKAARNRNLLYKQLLTCPFCGRPLSAEDFYIDPNQASVEVYCSDSNCMFYKYRKNRMAIPVYLVDEEIYRKCPTIILSTVDKFANLPWDEKTNALFGRVDRYCSRDGYVAIGETHKNHRKTKSLPASTIQAIKPFAPPELIIQDELHLITGPLGTIYGAYETIIENLCTYSDGKKIIRPKYVVSTATIKNAGEQAKCLYGRCSMSQFPPNGFEIGDSFFIREIPTAKDPFRKYVGVCASGQSVKTALLRVYAVILQAVYELSQDEACKDYIDPYYSLVGYFNSIRELGGTVRLLQDDIPKRIKRLKKKYGYDKERYLNHRVEITSRMSSYEIPHKLRQLETACTSKDCLDTAIATNMIAVGMDVDRLGLMIVTGQPKQNSEYIQATGRIGRVFPGLVITVYNPYRPRDLSHYENFTGYHAQLYRFVEGTTATPFSARARDRVMHALIISAIRLKYPDFAGNEGAGHISDLSDEQVSEIKAIILDRLNIIKPAAKEEAEEEIDQFLDWWKLLASQPKQLRYYVYTTERYNSLMNYYGEYCTDIEKATLNSMREVESAANMYYFTEE